MRALDDALFALETHGLTGLHFRFLHMSRLEAVYLPAPALASLGAFMLVGAGAVLPVIVAAGGGALIGALFGKIMHEHFAARVNEQLERGGLLLWVNVRNVEEEDAALECLRAHSAHDVHAHDIAA